MRRVLSLFLTMAVCGGATIAATWQPLMPLDVEVPREAYAGSCVGFGSSVEFRETIRDPLGGLDSNIFTIYDVSPDSDGSTSRDDEGYIPE